MKADRIREDTKFSRDGRLLVSYPKSGRTWLLYALSTAGIDVTVSHAGASTNRRQIGRRYGGIPAALGDVPLMFLHRNPIDTAVSMYYQVHKRDLRRWTGRWIRMFPQLVVRSGLPPKDINSFVCDPVWGAENVCRYNRTWLDHLAQRTDCLVLTYEEMRQDPGQGFQRILDYLGESGVQGADLAQASDFSRMRQVEAQGGDAAGVLKPARGGSSADSVKVRKGDVQGYFSALTPDAIVHCKRIAASYGFDS